jgi:hypothetical protein
MGTRIKKAYLAEDPLCGSGGSGIAGPPFLALEVDDCRFRGQARDPRSGLGSPRSAPRNMSRFRP